VQTIGSSTKLIIFNMASGCLQGPESIPVMVGFRARSEAIFFCFWWKCVAAGVGRVSAYVGDAGEARFIVLRSVVV